MGFLTEKEIKVKRLEQRVEEERKRADKYFREIVTMRRELDYYMKLCSQKNFPITLDNQRFCVIPYWLAEAAYEFYVKKYGDRESLEDIMKRGGFTREELLMSLRQDCSVLSNLNIIT